MEVLSSVSDSSKKECEAEVTIVAKLKHPELWEAAKKLGSQAALARFLGVTEQEVGKWINLKAIPPLSPARQGTKWTSAFLEELDRRSLAATGKLWAELFPDEIRAIVYELSGNNTAERRVSLRGDELLAYREKEQRRLEPYLDVVQRAADNERRDSVRRIVKLLPNERDQEVLVKRFGLNGDTPMTLAEIGKVMNIGRERVRMLEQRALRDLRGMWIQYGLPVWDD